MRFLSTFSGIEAASVAWNPLGWKAGAVAEIEPFCCALLAYRFPGIPNLGDATRFMEWPDLGTVDLVCGGTPCQSFSVAGLRQGLADPRGNLSLTFIAIVDRYRPRWVVWENVPGVLSDDGGRSFAAILGSLGILGYGWCYRVLDAQYVRVDGFGRAVPQRRRRVIVVGCLGDWRCAAAVLSEPESVLGDHPPRRQARKGIAPSLKVGSGGSSGHFDQAGQHDGLIAQPDIANPLTHRMHKGVNTTMDEGQTMVAVAPTLEASGNRTGGTRPPETTVDTADTLVAHSLRADGFDAGEDGTGRGTPVVPVGFTCKDYGSDAADGVAPTLRAMEYDGSHANGGGQIAIAIQERAVSENLDTIPDGRARIGPDGKGWSDSGAAYSLESRQTPQAVAFAQNQRDEVRTMDVAGALAAASPILANEGRKFTDEGKVMQLHNVVPAVAFQPRFARNGRGAPDDVAAALTAEAGRTGKGDSAQAVQHGWAVRRLMPVECERLMGFPDGWTDIPYRGKPAADGPRYKALGNSWPTNVFRWVGRRIEMVERIKAEIDREGAA